MRVHHRGFLKELCFFVFFPTMSLAESVQYGSCTVQLDAQMKLSLDSNAAMASLRGFNDVNSFIFGRLCDWRPGAQFIVGGMVKTSSGSYSLRQSSEGLDEVDVSVDGCTFQMSFGQVGNEFILKSNKDQCDAAKQRSAEACQIDYVEERGTGGDFGGSCRGFNYAFSGTYSDFNKSYTVAGPSGVAVGSDRNSTILEACGCK